MKVLPFRIPKPELDALVYQEDIEHVFYDKLHQHEEIQISLIRKGRGTLIVGDTINDYKENDILVIGSNVPHVFRSEKDTEIISHMITLFFTKEAFGEQFFNLEELREILPFFKRANYGFKVVSRGRRPTELFLELKNSTKLKRFIILLKLLRILSRVKHESLSSFIYHKQYTDIEGKRMSAVMEYTINNYAKDISLSEVATVATLTKNAFCKYFKKRTNKTYFRFLNELRIENACRLLTQNNDLSVAEIAEQSGFNNISNFNRKFKEIKGITPTTIKSFK